MKILKKCLISLGILLGVVILFVLGYVCYILISYHRIGNVDLNIDKGAELNQVEVGNTYSVSTYNLGFGAYSQDYTFFLDTGYDIDGNETCGYYSKAFSKDEVIKNINGSIKTIENLNNDFVFLQEVDIDSTRSYHVDEAKLFKDAFSKYDSIFCMNFDTAFMPYPLYDMHGKSKAGLQTLSKYKVTESKRHEYTVSKSFSKFFDLDRCFSVSVVEVNNNKKLYLVNSHMSAYDKGGVIKEKQVVELNNFLKACKENGDYVIVGGDFNHDLITYNPDFNYDDKNIKFNNKTKKPLWEETYFNKEGKSPLIDGYKVVAADNLPTCRNNDIPWDPEMTYKTVVDGFIVSSNIEVVEILNIETKNGSLGLDGFAFSDHQPSNLKFKLK